MKVVLLFVMVAVIGFFAVSYVYKEKPENALWLHGTWQLAYDPDGNVKDYMVFDSAGQVALKSNLRNAYATCQYASKIGHVTISCMVKGKERKIALEVSPDNNRLTNSSGAYYSKM